MSLHRHVPLLVATSSLLVGCGRSLLGDTDTDADTGMSSDPSDPSVDPSSDPSDPSIATLESSVDPTDPQPHPGPPLLVDAIVRDPTSIELFFSEPVAATGGVDPTRFRLSGAFANAYYSYGTFYTELGRWNGDEMCYEYCYGNEYGESGQYCNEWCYTPPGPPVNIAAVLGTAYADRVILSLDQAIKPSVCRQLQQRLENGADAAAIFLHYSNNGQGITDLDGEQLQAISEAWVLLTTQYYSYMPGFFTAMDPFIPIDCPFA